MVAKSTLLASQKHKTMILLNQLKSKVSTITIQQQHPEYNFSAAEAERQGVLPLSSSLKSRQRQ